MEPYGGLSRRRISIGSRGRAQVHELPHDSALLPDRACLLTGRNHTSTAWHHHRGDDGLPEPERPHPVRVRDARRGARRARLEHVHGRQVAPHRRRRDEPGLEEAQWPVGRGFERCYGFLGGETNQWYPDLSTTTSRSSSPRPPEEGYHLRPTSPTRRSRSSATRRRSRRTSRSSCTAPARRTPAPCAEGVDRQVQGQVRHGLRGYRELVFERRKKLGIFPERPSVTDQPLHGRAEPRRKAVESSRRRAAVGLALRRREASVPLAWQRVRRASCRMRITRSGGCSTSSRQSGELENTIVVFVSDNGASGEGGPERLRQREQVLQRDSRHVSRRTCKYLDDLAGSTRTYNHYPVGWAWAFNTPFKMWKRYTIFEGGVADPH